MAVPNPPETVTSESEPFFVILGIAQDAGYPQLSCREKCCEPAWRDRSLRRYPCCAALVDPASGQRWLIDCTPSFPDQLRELDRLFPVADKLGIAGIFLTHAHVGHYTGLIHLGREVIGAKGIPVYVMAKMEKFLRNHGPWSLLVDLKNIKLRQMTAGRMVRLTNRISVTPTLVPHRGEFSETVAFRIQSNGRSIFYVPDIDSWNKSDPEIDDVLRQVDRAYVDGTFYSPEELPGRDLSKIPHPFIRDTIKRFAGLPDAERRKIRFLHLNHTNPAHLPGSAATQQIRAAGHGIAQQGERFAL